jgi:hypothetical protein
MIWALVAIMVAVVVGVFVIRPRLVARVDTDVQGIKTEHVVAPMVTLSVFLCAFVVAQATSSYRAATDQAGVEAGAVDQFFETAGLLPDGAGRRIQAATVCYARAVQRQEWDSMRDGRTAPGVGVWTDVIREEIPAVLEGPSPVVGALLNLDRARSEARRLRLTEMVPSIPVVVLVLMFLGVLGVVLALTTLPLPPIRRGPLLALTATIGLLLGSTLWLVEELEEPYSGVVHIQPDAIERTAASGAEDYEDAYGEPLPCDEDGRPLS